MRNRIQPFDAVFEEPIDRAPTTDPVTLSRQVIERSRVVGQSQSIGGEAKVGAFTDSSPEAYYDAANPRGSTRTAGSGVRVEVLDQASVMTVDVTYPPAW